MVKNVNVKKAYERRNAAMEKAIEKIRAAKLAPEMVHISNGNSKMGPIPNISMLPLITCTNCGKCSKNCYACLGAFNFSGNVENLAINTALMIQDPETVEKAINDKLNNEVIIYKYFRFNVAGDIAGPVENNYFPMMVRVAKDNPITKFLAFTKNYKLVNDYLNAGNTIPENLTIVFSQWGNDIPENPHSLPVAIVKLDENTIIPENAFHCSGNCDTCLQCWKATPGKVVYFDLH